MPELDEPFAERVERLKHELALALRWDRPSILVAVYASAFVRADAEALLEVWLREQGQAVARVQVLGPDDPAADVPRRLREWPERSQTVFFISGLRQGAPTTWNSLNVRREYLVDDRIRAIFWLTEGEAAELPRRAPDFWAFRHRVVEFVEPPETGRAVQKARELAWAGFEKRLPPGERQARIAFREQVLAELPDTPETAAARAELHYTLGGLYDFGRDYVAALKYLQTALDLAEQVGDSALQSWVLNGLGNVYRDLGRHDEAIATYRTALEIGKLSDGGAKIYSGLGNVYHDLGRYDEAVAAFQRAIELDPTYASPHNGLGNVYRDLGRHDEAIAAYQKAVELDPSSVYPHYNWARLEAVRGDTSAALEHLARAIAIDPHWKEYAREAVEFEPIRDDPRFRELTGDNHG
jgi:tetratricopeptide (TPR) repeat protein